MEGSFEIAQSKECEYEPKIGDRVIINDPSNSECHGAAGKIYWIEKNKVSVVLDMDIDTWEGSMDCIELENKS